MRQMNREMGRLEQVVAVGEKQLQPRPTRDAAP
jgi:hypothetical protein